METEPQENETLEAVRDKLALVNAAMVAYQTPSGEMRSEPLQTAKMDKEGNLWFFIESQALIRAIAHNPRINLNYRSGKEGIYISVGGIARILQNRAIQEALWRGRLKRWSPHGPTGEHVSLLKVEVGYCEYWDEPRSNLFRMLLKAVNAVEGESISLTHRQITVASHERGRAGPI